MKKRRWEYKVINAWDNEYMQKLIDAGDAGWELVSATYASELRYCDWVLFFKRPAEEEDAR